MESTKVVCSGVSHGGAAKRPALGLAGWQTGLSEDGAARVVMPNGDGCIVMGNEPHIASTILHALASAIVADATLRSGAADGARVTVESARMALSDLDACARMESGVDAIGSRSLLESFIAQVERNGGGELVDLHAEVPRLDWAARTVRAIADLGRDKQLGDWYPQAVMVAGLLKDMAVEMNGVMRARGYDGDLWVHEGRAQQQTGANETMQADADGLGGEGGGISG